MPAGSDAVGPHNNLLLRAFDSESLERINPHLKRVEVQPGDTVCDAGAAVEHVYFPESAVLSLLTVLDDGTTIETANIGREGAFGLFAAMHDHSHLSCRNSATRCLVQFHGTLFRVPAEVLAREFEHSAHIRNLFVGCCEALVSQIQQTVACCARHTIRQKICRWLLTRHDHADGQDISCTHEFMAMMLGLNRKSVTLAVQALQRAGLIDYHRGRMQVLDRGGLEKSACECYATLKERVETLLNPASACDGE